MCSAPVMRMNTEEIVCEDVRHILELLREPQEGLIRDDVGRHLHHASDHHASHTQTELQCGPYIGMPLQPHTPREVSANGPQQLDNNDPPGHHIIAGVVKLFEPLMLDFAES